MVLIFGAIAVYASRRGWRTRPGLQPAAPGPARDNGGVSSRPGLTWCWL